MRWYRYDMDSLIQHDYMIGFLIKETHRDGATWRQRQRLKCCSYQPRHAKDWWPSPEAKKKQGRILPCRFLEYGPAETFILDFWPLELWDNKFVVLSHFVVLWYRISRKLTQDLPYNLPACHNIAKLPSSLQTRVPLSCPLPISSPRSNSEVLPVYPHIYFPRMTGGWNIHFLQENN